MRWLRHRGQVSLTARWRTAASNRSRTGFARSRGGMSRARVRFCHAEGSGRPHVRRPDHVGCDHHRALVIEQVANALCKRPCARVPFVWQLRSEGALRGRRRRPESHVDRCRKLVSSDSFHATIMRTKQERWQEAIRRSALLLKPSKRDPNRQCRAVLVGTNRVNFCME